MDNFKGYAHSTASWELDKDKTSPMLLSVENYCYEVEADRDIFFAEFVDCHVIVNCDGKVDGERVCTLKKQKSDKPFVVRVLEIADASSWRDTALTDAECERIADKMLATRRDHGARPDEELAGYIA